MKVSIPQRLVVALLLLLEAFAVAGVFAYRSALDVMSAVESSGPSHETLAALGRMHSLITEIESSERGFAVTGSAGYLTRYVDASEAVRRELDILGALTADTRLQQERFDLLRSRIHARLGIADRVVGLRKSHGRKAAERFIAGGPGVRIAGSIRKDIAGWEAVERRTLPSRSQEVRIAARRALHSILGSAAAAVIIAGVSLFLFGRQARQRRRAERLRSESEEKFGLLAQGAREYALSMLDAEGLVVGWNPGAERITGYGAEEISGKHFSSLYPDDAVRLGKPGQGLEAAALQGRSEEEGRRIRKDGTVYWAREAFYALRDEENNLRGYAVVTQDITEQRRARETIDKLSLSVEHVTDLVVITDAGGKIEYVNRAVEESTGYSREELTGKTSDVWRPHQLDGMSTRAAPGDFPGSAPDRAVVAKRKKNGELFYVSEAAAPMKDSEGNVAHLIITGRDITRQKLLEDQLHYLSQYDPLTGVHNRKQFVIKLGREIARAMSDARGLAVLVIGIDRFKHINDIFGLHAGNSVLKRVAERIRGSIGSGNVAARIGSDEFGIALRGAARPDDIVPVVTAIMNNVARGIPVDGQEVFVTPSIGVALCPSDGTEAETLIRNADVALAHAKARGVNSFHFYSADITAKMSELLLMEQRLYEALRNNEYEVTYQPYCDLAEKKVAGAEALIRWNNRDFGVVSPTKFIPMLEHTGMIIDVGEWVLKAVCAQVKKMGNGRHGLPVSVNLSPAQFRHDRLGETVEQTIRTLNMNPKRLTFEVTESVFMEDISFAQSVLKRLKGIGVAISIDDFGTGYSSLSYLKKLPVDIVKIDRSFVQDVTNDPDAASIVSGITGMARSLSLKTIAEGVETEEQWKVLRLLRCDMGQGYYFSPALHAADFEKFLGHSRALPGPATVPPA